MEKREIALREEEKWKDLIQKHEEEYQRRFLKRRRVKKNEHMKKKCSGRKSG